MAARDPTRSPIRAANVKRLRRDSTDAERILWRHLRGNQLGAKFRRQHPIGPYIVDFYCAEKSLAVELDGGQHFLDAGRIQDAQRSEALAALGVRVARFSNVQALTETEALVDAIRQLLVES